MNKLFKLILSLLVFCGAVACGNNGETVTPDVTPSGELTLEASELEVVVGPDSYVDFTVMCGETDVTSDAKVYYEVEGKSTRLAEPRFLVEKRIAHTFYATYNNQISDKIVVVGDLDLQLIPDASPVLVGDDAVVNFTVTASGEDVTDIAKIYHRMAGDKVENAKWIPATFAMTEVGEHIFHVVYNGISSDEVLVYGVKNLIEKVADSAPDQYNSFRRKVMALFATSTECMWCPIVIKGFEESFEIEAVEENLIPTVLHGTLGSDDTDPMYCDASKKVITDIGFDQIGYPTLNFNMANGEGFTTGVPSTPSDNPGKVEALKAQIEAITKSLSANNAACALSGSSIVNGDVIAVRADVKVAADGEYLIGAWITQDGNKAEQYKASLFPDYDFSTHNNAVCATFPSPQSKSLFVNLGGVELQKAGNDYMFYCEFDKANFSTLNDFDKCNVVIFIYDNFTLSIDNVIKFPVGGEQEVLYN